MKRVVRNGLVAGWVVLAAGGWGLTQWLGEPVATDGPTPGTTWTPNPASGGGPGPQPEHWYDKACENGTPAPLPSAAAVPDDAGDHRSAIVCARAERGDGDN
ncbi:hypothetical protein [Streptomyces sp. NBC_00057]|uniref:hypothetical protein n=1 Tax=Streptomyces sp. NBC_00057 TaxID=2975634 RepID=UPI00324AE5C5